MTKGSSKYGPNFITKVFLAAVAFLVCAAASQLYAQDLQVSQVEFAPLKINPANVGTAAKMRANLISRNQWKSVGTPIRSFAASFDMILSSQRKTDLQKSRMAAGISFSKEKYNPVGVNLFRVDLALAYHVRLGKNSTLGGGLDIGIDQHSFLAEDGKWGSQFNGYFYDPGLASGEQRSPEQELSMDFGIGVVFHSLKPTKKRKWTIDNSISAGISAYHLGRVKMSETNSLTEGQRPRVTGFANAEIAIGKKTGLQPMIYAQMHQNNYQLFVGSRIKYILNDGMSFMNDTKPMYASLGLFIRTNDAVIIESKIAWAAYAVGLSYDINYAGLNSESSGRGAFEIGLKWIYHGKR